MSVPQHMQAVIIHGPGDFRVETVPVPVPGDGEVLIRVGAAGICGSDIKCFQGAALFWGEDGISGYAQPPAVAGHEFAGEVVALGAGAAELHDVALGDVVVAEQIIPCGKCRFCQRGFYWMCQRNLIFGFRSEAWGGMAEYCLLPKQAIIHPVDPRLSKSEAAYIEPLACTVHAVEQAHIQPGDTVVVTGIGNIALCMVQVARLYNPGLLIAVGTRPGRLALARQLGADEVLNVREEDIVARVRELTEGYGADVCIEASGAPEGPQQAIELLRKMGRLVAFSSIKDKSLINWNLVGDQKELSIQGSHLGPYCYPKAIQMIARGQVDVKSLITAQFPLSEWDQALAAAMSGEQIKVMLDISALPYSADDQRRARRSDIPQTSAS